MSTFREKHYATGVLADLIEDCGDGYCRYKDPDMTDGGAAEVINAKVSEHLREPFTAENVRYIRAEIFGKLYDKDGGRARPVGDFDAQEAIKRTRDELFGEISLVRAMAIKTARYARDLATRLGEDVPVEILEIAETPTWSA